MEDHQLPSLRWCQCLTSRYNRSSEASVEFHSPKVVHKTRQYLKRASISSHPTTFFVHLLDDADVNYRQFRSGKSVLRSVKEIKMCRYIPERAQHTYS